MDLIIEDDEFVIETYGQSLSSIASECDLELGYPVYFARSLCKTLGLYFEEGNCESQKLANTVNLSQKSAINFYPNPATDNIIIESQKNIRYIKIYSLDNKLIKVSNFDQSSQISLSLEGLKSGFYLIEINFEDKLTNMVNLIKI